MAIDAIAHAAFEALSQAGLPPIYRPNVEVPAAPESLHLRAFILPANTESMGLASWDVERGILQVSVYAKHGVGIVPPYSIAEQVLAVFPRGYADPSFRVIVAGSVGPALIDGAWCVVPVSIPYQNVR